MARYSVGFSTGITASQAVLEIIGSGQKARLMEIGLTIQGATLTRVGLGYSGSVGVTPTGGATLLTEGAESAATGVSFATAWGTAPAAPTNGYYYRKATIPASQAFPTVWRFPEGLALLPATSLALFLLATGSLIDGWIVLEE